MVKVINKKNEQFLNAAQSTADATKWMVGVWNDYRYVAIYILGSFRSIFSGYGQGFGNMAAMGQETSQYGASITMGRFVERWDTSSTTIAEQTAGSFRQAILPTGLDSFCVKAENGAETLNRMLRAAWPNDALTEINRAVSDYINYGTAVMTCACRYVNINTVNYLELLDKTGQFSRIYSIRPSFLGWNYTTGSNFARNYEPDILVIDPLIPEELTRLIRFNRAPSFSTFCMEEMVAGTFCNYPPITAKDAKPAKDESGCNWHEYDRPYLYEKIYIARTGTIRNGYGTGSGVNALGPALKANYATATEYMNMQRANDPPFIVSSAATIKSSNGTSAFGTAPGSITFVGVTDTENVPVELNKMCQEFPVGIQRFTEFAEIREKMIAEVEKAYQANIFEPFEPAPNESATSASYRMSRMIANYRAKADAFTESILMPLAKHILTRQLATLFKAGLLAKVFEDDQIDDETLALFGVGKGFEIELKDYAYESEHRLKVMQLTEEMQIRGALAQQEQAQAQQQQVQMQAQAQQGGGMEGMPAQIAAGLSRGRDPIKKMNDKVNSTFDG